MIEESFIPSSGTISLLKNPSGNELNYMVYYSQANLVSLKQFLKISFLRMEEKVLVNHDFLGQCKMFLSNWRKERKCNKLCHFCRKVLGLFMKAVM